MPLKSGRLVVERILDKKEVFGKTYYLVKLRGNKQVWKRAADLTCGDLIAAYEQTNQHFQAPEPIVALADLQNNQNANETGFARGLEPEKILFAQRKGDEDEFCFGIKWKGSDEVELVPAKLAKINCEQLVIAFYESVIYFER